MRMNRTVGSILPHVYANKRHLPHRDIGQPGSQKLELMYQKIANTAVTSCPVPPVDSFSFPHPFLFMAFDISRQSLLR